AKRRRADQAADSANMTRVPSRSTTPEMRVAVSAGRRSDSQPFQKFARATWAVTRIKVGARRAIRSFTECIRRGPDPGAVLTGEPPRLSRLTFLGILPLSCIGKPAERRGRKATGLKRGAMTAGLPASYRYLSEREQSDTRSGPL